MLHLDPERLAALADEAPTAEEGAHLAHCLACRRERDAYVALLALAQREGRAAAAWDAPDGMDAEPLTSWASLSTALRAEGLLTTPAAPTVDHADVRVLPLRPAMAAPPARATGRDRMLTMFGGAALRRVAAAALFVAGGMAAGRVSVGAPALPLTDAAPVVATASPEAADAAGSTLLTAGASSFASVDEASRVLARAQREYQRAAVFLAEHDSSAAVGSSDVLRARLAALDDMMPRVREALSEAPEDPVLNQVYLTTYDVRESTLRQLGRTLPVGARVNGY